MKAIKGSYVGNQKDTSEAIDFFKRGLTKAPFKTVGLSKLQEVYDLMRKSPWFLGMREQAADTFAEQGKIAGRYMVDTSK